MRKTLTIVTMPSRSGASVPPKAEAPARTSTSRLAGLAVTAGVFGVPFIYCLQGALRGQLFVGRYTFFGNDSMMPGLVAWAMTSALGSIWLGVSLQMDLVPRLPERIKNAVVVGLIFAGVAILLFGARLLGFRTAS